MKALGLLPVLPHQRSILVPAAIIAAGFLISWLCRVHPAALPTWAPWDFSWSEYLGIVFPLWWYLRGLRCTTPERVPATWRHWSFLSGLVLIYIVLLTHFEYLSQHMFALNRVQHLILHHVGPFLIALAWPGDTIRYGLPSAVARLFRHSALQWVLSRLQQPVIAGSLFVGLLFLWLIPAVHLRAMIDPRLYAVMNLSMLVDGLLFWCLVLDPRSSPPARLSFMSRILLVLAVQVPQIMVGALIGFTGRDLYPYYDLCGRVFPGIDPGLDQQIGGSVVWLLGGMMSAIAALVLFRAIQVDEEKLPIS